jgi:seryl-tRNA synthetase
MGDKKDPEVETPDTTGETGDGTGEKVFTQDDLNKHIGKTKVELKAHFQKQLEEALAKERAEAEKLAKLSAEEKEKEMLDKANKDLSERAKAVTLQENTLKAKSDLLDKGIPKELADFVVDVDEDKQNDKIERLTENWNVAIQKAVEDKLKGTTPKDVTPASQTPKRGDVSVL